MWESVLVTLPLLIRVSVLLDQGSILMTLFNLHHLLKDPISNIVTQRVGASAHEFEGNLVQSLANAIPPLLNWQASVTLLQNSARISSLCVLYLALMLLMVGKDKSSALWEVLLMKTTDSLRCGCMDKFPVL